MSESTNPEPIRVVASKKGSSATLHLCLLQTLIRQSMDNTHYEHEVSLRPSHSRLLAQEAWIQIPSGRPLHRYLSARGP